MGRPLGTDAISEVVGFVIMLAVVMAGLSLDLMYAVPVQGREAEIKEMDSVRAWFVDYKTGVDQLWLNSPLVPQTGDGGDPALHGATIGQVTLRRVLNTGTARETGFVGRYLPVLAPIPASAEVSVRDPGTLTISGWRNGTKVFTGRTPPPPSVHLAQQLLVPAGVPLPARRRLSPPVGSEGWFRRRESNGGRGAPALDLPPEVENTDQYKVELVVVNLTPPKPGFGATSPIRVETRLDRTRPSPTWKAGDRVLRCEPDLRCGKSGGRGGLGEPVQGRCCQERGQKYTA